MTFEVVELIDPTPARPGLDTLAQLNSAHVDLDKEAALGYARFWIAHSGTLSEPSAYALVWLVGGEAEIIDFATAPDRRRQGAGSRVLTALIERCRELRLEALFLEVRANNSAAIGLYTRCGFERTRVRRGYYSNGEDAWDMRKDLGT